MCFMARLDTDKTNALQMTHILCFYYTLIFHFLGKKVRITLTKLAAVLDETCPVTKQGAEDCFSN